MPRKTKKQTRRGNKEGSIYQRKDGKWCGQVLTGYNEEGKPVRKTFYGETREEVAKKVSGATHQVFQGEAKSFNLTDITVSQLVKDYLWTFKKPSVSDVTFEWYLFVQKNHIDTSIGELPAQSLNAYQIQMLLNRMSSEKNLSQRTLKGVRDTLNQAYTHAVKMKFIAENPVLDTKIPKPPRIMDEEENGKRIIPIHMRTTILEAAETNLPMKTVITVLMFTGMRIGEFLALIWGNVDFDNQIITIDRSLTHTCEYDREGNLSGRSNVVGLTKTQCSKRKVKVSHVVVSTLETWKAEMGQYVKPKDGRDIFAKDAVVFPNKEGNMRTYDGFRTNYRRFMDKHNLGDYPIHSYRHTFATMLLEAGTNPKVVQKLLGHRDVETTLGTYSHVLPEVFDGAADTMAAIHADMLDGSYKPTAGINYRR